jgi:hypothetical protein
MRRRHPIAITTSTATACANGRDGPSRNDDDGGGDASDIVPVEPAPPL